MRLYVSSSARIRSTIARFFSFAHAAETMCARAASLSCRLSARRGLATIALALVASVESSPTVSQDTAPAPKVQAAHKHVPSDSHRKLFVFHTHTPSPPETTCTNTCTDASDGACDDGGPGAEFSICGFGTDCVDCGPRSTLALCPFCGTCDSQMTITGSTYTYKKTDQYYICDACFLAGGVGGRQMYIYQGWSSSTTVTNSYLWFDCSGGGWKRSIASSSCGGGQFACINPGQYGTVVDTFTGFTSCPGSGASCSLHSHSPHCLLYTSPSPRD